MMKMCMQDRVCEARQADIILVQRAEREVCRDRRDFFFPWEINVAEMILRHADS